MRRIRRLSYLSSSWQLFRERLSETNVHATIPKGNMGYEQYTVPDSAAVKPTGLLLLFFSTRKHMSMTSHTILSNFFEKQWTQNRPTVPFGIVACTFSDNFSRNSCMCNLYEPNCDFFRRRFVEQIEELSRWTYCTGRNIRPTKF